MKTALSRDVAVGRFAKAMALLVTLAAQGGGCTLHHVETRPLPAVDVPTAFANAAEGGVAADRWWEQFGDEGLNAVVSRALEGSFDVRIAWARLEQAGAVARGADSAWWPRVTADGTASRSRSNFQFGSFTNNQFDLSFGVSYEVDLWGKVLSRTRAAELDAMASADDVRTAAMTVVAQVADAWFQRAEQQALAALLERQRQLNRTYLELVQMRFSQGVGSAVDVLQQRQRVEAIDAQMPLVRARAQVIEHLLAALVGAPPGANLPASPTVIPELPPPPGMGVPASLLVRRPDVRAQQMRIVAADHRVAAAVAEYMPTFRLSASTGFRAFELVSLFENWIYNIAAGFSVLLWDGGARTAEVERTEAVVKELVIRYGQVVVQAIREVEDAAVQERYQREQLAELEHQLVTARATLDQTRVRYVEGLSDYLPVLTALIGVQQLEQSLLAGRRQLLSHRVQLYRALGGAWYDELEPPGADAPGQEAEGRGGNQPSDGEPGSR